MQTVYIFCEHEFAITNHYIIVYIIITNHYIIVYIITLPVVNMVQVCTHNYMHMYTQKCSKLEWANRTPKFVSQIEN